MTIAVLGGSGFVGRYLAERWTAAPNVPPLRLLLHRSRPDWLDGLSAEIRSIALDDPASYKRALEDCVVLINLLRPHGDDWARSTLEALLPAIAGSGLRAVVHSSSIDVYGAAADNPVTEATVADPRTPYSREHLAIEHLVAGSGVPATILRIGAVFGTGGRNLVKLAQDTTTNPDWKLALRSSLYGHRRMYLVAVEMVADVIRFVALRPARKSVEHLLVTEDDDEENNFAFVQERVAAAIGRKLPTPPTLPPAFLRLALAARGSVADPFQRISGSKLAGLGFKPDLSFRERIERFAAALAIEHANARI
jgi:nucleoside-diphosphate-sugar epimerase